MFFIYSTALLAKVGQFFVVAIINANEKGCKNRKKACKLSSFAKI